MTSDMIQTMWTSVLTWLQTNSDVVQTLFIAGGVIVAAISATIAVFSIRADHDRRRRQATLDFCHQLQEKEEQLQKEIEAVFSTEKINPNDSRYIENKGLQHAIRCLLNLYEDVSVGVNFNITDLEVFMRLEGKWFITWHKRLKQVVEKKREEAKRPTRYGDFEILANKLKLKYDKQPERYGIKHRLFLSQHNEIQRINKFSTFVLSDEKDVDNVFALYVTREKWFKDKGINQWVDYTAKHRFPKEYFLRQIREQQYFALKQEEEIIAGCVRLPFDEEMWGKTKNSVFIKHFVSDIDYKGAGAIFLQKLFKYSKKDGYKIIRLDCRDDNESLKTYYRKNGFIEVGKRPYDETVNACLMERKL